MGDGRVGQAELAVLAAAPLRRRNGEGGGWSGLGRGGFASIKTNEFELSPARRREAPALDRWVERVEREAGRTTNRVSTPSSSSSAISKVEL